MSQLRAARGGQRGVNGEFYEGGKFLPSTDRPKGKPHRRESTGRRQIAPYVWEHQPSPDHFPIFAMVGAQAEYVDRYATEVKIRPFDPGTAYYGDKYHGHLVSDLCDLWNRGERWVTNKS